MFSGLLAGDEPDSDSHKVGVRRRAYTEVGDLLADDFIKAKEQEMANSADVKNEQSNLLATPTTTKERKRDMKLVQKLATKELHSINANSLAALGANTMGDNEMIQHQQNLMRSIAGAGALGEDAAAKTGSDAIDGNKEKNEGGLFSGVANMMARRKLSLDLEHKEKVRNQDLKNLLNSKLQAWLKESKVNSGVTRHDALGIKPQQPA